ncbi:putative Gnk2-like domain-containing protein [Helianthus annuus]|uniref:Gnk2-like domain-containing protein n=1 Tax=Helianthus annuus TaxID=4232 RepID=A0A251TUH1_HELAN|nr:cysteine-rich repeat secretory protein 38 [Helianthus annuus]KAF5764971.1 putative Gnk2-like domain-containing protein [Helianthus annuus]KAJ0451579.1 putative Gnk2-like domain-containing protein [Helianthus annuus]KAJ0456135.1 putative Gnk2-like domain-containing protein [Helianthus annuus]KAJ0473456.1 putative Gnk2-like domain-containing protein [Helianthus annuus]KAJ0649040.1 putative Gnk2-like domain-containing protein [Helianthus annuus]
MKKQMKMKTIILLLLLLQIILNVVNFTMAEPINSEIFRCKKDSGTYQLNSLYQTNLVSALKSLPALTSKSVGVKPNEVTAVELCAGYLNPQDCKSCVDKTIPLLLQKCPNQKGAAAWRVKCMVKYGQPVLNNYDVWFVANEVSDIITKDVVGLQNTLSSLVNKLLLRLYKGQPMGYAFGTQDYKNNRIVYMVMQCTDDISHKDCTKCILHVSGEIKRCCSGAIAAAILTPNCYLRYTHSDFRVLK